MGTVRCIDYKIGTDKQFDLCVRRRNSNEPFDLSEFFQVVGEGLRLRIEGENDVVELTLDSSPIGRLEVLSVASGLAGKVRVTFLNGIDLRRRSGINMELSIDLPSAPADSNDNCVQFPGVLNVTTSLFE